MFGGYSKLSTIYVCKTGNPNHAANGEFSSGPGGGGSGSQSGPKYAVGSKIKYEGDSGNKNATRVGTVIAAHPSAAGGHRYDVADARGRLVLNAHDQVMDAHNSPTPRLAPGDKVSYAGRTAIVTGSHFNNDPTDAEHRGWNTELTLDNGHKVSGTPEQSLSKIK